MLFDCWQTESVLSSSKEIKLSYHKNEALEKTGRIRMFCLTWHVRLDVGQKLHLALGCRKRLSAKIGCPILSNIAA